MIDRELLLFRKQRVGSVGEISSPKITLPSQVTTGKDWKFSVPIYKFSARTTPRKSMTGENVFLDLTSVNWKGYPDRRYSVFTSQQGEHTTKFDGEFGIIIPADNVALYGFSPTDFNDSTSTSAPAKFRKNVESVLNQVKYLFKAMASVIHNVEKGNELRTMIYDACVDRDLLEFVSDYLYKLNAGDKIMRVANLADWTIRKYSEFSKIKSVDEIVLTFVESVFELAQSLVEANFKSVTDMFNAVSPENYKAKAYTSLSQIPVKNSTNEVWFVGDYLFLEMPLSAKNFPKEMSLSVLKDLRDSRYR